MVLIGGSVSETALRCFLSWGRISGIVSAFLIFLIVFSEPLTPFTSLRVAVLRARLSDGGGDCDVSDADGCFGCVGLRNVEVLAVLDTCVLDAKVVRDEVREGALAWEASIEACERLRDGM